MLVVVVIVVIVVMINYVLFVVYIHFISDNGEGHENLLKICRILHETWV